MKKESGKYGKSETHNHFLAALCGAFKSRPKRMTPKRPEAQRKKTKAAKRGS
jgi:hypothetical protein